MGQTSSQLASTQTQDAGSNPLALNNLSQLSSNHTPTAIPPPPARKKMAAPSANTKRARPLAEDEAEGGGRTHHNAKKPKTSDHGRHRKQQHASRSVPQHRRGTAIMPSQDAPVSHTRLQNGESHGNSNMGAALRQSPSSSGEEFYDASSVVLEYVPDNGKNSRHMKTLGQQEKLQTTAAKPSETRKKQHGGHSKNAEDDAVQVLDVVMNPIGQPGPRKRKNLQPIENVKGRADSTHPTPYRDISVASDAEFDRALEMMKQNPILDKALGEEKDDVKLNAMLDRFVLDNGLDMTLLVENAKRRIQQQDQENASSSQFGLPQVQATSATSKRKRSAKQPKQANHQSSVVLPRSTAADSIATSHAVPEKQSSVLVNDTPNGNDVINANDMRQDADYDPRVREGYVDPTEKISTWMDHPHSPGPPDQLPPPRGSPHRAKKKSSTYRKQLSNPRVDDSDEYQENRVRDDEEPIKKTEAKPKTKVKKPTQSNKEHQIKNSNGSPSNSQPAQPQAKADASRGAIKGAWTAEEKALADTIFDTGCKEFNMTPFEMKRQLIDWAGTPEGFKNDMYDAFPLRQKKGVSKFCQRRFHAYKTGAWSEDDDRELKKWHAQFPNNWVEIGSYIDRHPGACRDRWTNIVNHGRNMEKGPWTMQEEEELGLCVESAMVILRDECNDEDVKNDPDRLEMLINWNAVSENMKSTKRSAKRCREKWQSLKHRITLQADAALQQSIVQPQKGQLLSKKQKTVDTAYGRLGWADVYDALTEICTAMSKELERTFQHESTLWSIVGTRTPGSNFPPKLRRRCYYSALEEFGTDSIERSVGIGMKAGQLREVMWEMKKEGKLEWERNSVVKAGRQEHQARDRKRSNSLAAKKIVSAEFVYNSDDEAEVSDLESEVIEVHETQETDDDGD